MTELEDVFIKEVKVVDVETETSTKHRYLKIIPEFGELGLYELSDGKIKLNPETYVIPAFKSQPNISRQRTKSIKNQRRR